MLRRLHLLSASESHGRQILKAISTERKLEYRSLHLAQPRHSISTTSQTHSFKPQLRKFSSKNGYVDFIPPIDEEAKLILPISVGRYNTTDPIYKKEINQEINALLTKTADMLKFGKIASVDVICTAGLHTDWGHDKISEIENLFFNTHATLLSQQSAIYTWDNWIEAIGRNKYLEALKEITDKSQKGSQWYNLMVTTHESVKTSSDLEFSLQYQRKEYAAISLMQNYTNLVYLGKISPARPFLYETLPNTKLPLFTRAAFKLKQPEIVNPSEIKLLGRIIFEMVERILTDPNIPDKEKTAIANNITSLFYAYAPKKRTNIKDNHDSNQKHPSHNLKV